MHPIVHDFVQHLRLNEKSPNTIRRYKVVLEDFFQFEGTPQEVKHIKKSHINTFLLSLKDSGAEKRTRNNVLAVLRSFFNYLCDEEIVKSNPAKVAKYVKLDKSLPKFLTFFEMKKLLNGYENLKEKAILYTTYITGGRVSEIINLTVDDIQQDGDKFYVRLFGKGNKERLNPIYDEVAQILKDYISAYKITSGYLFPHRTKAGQPMTADGVYRMVKRVADRVGIDRKLVSPHVFRHSFATHMLDSGTDISVVQELLGHSNISTTRIYAQVTQNRKQSALQIANLLS
jgi:Site-specific recombinase XerD